MRAISILGILSAAALVVAQQPTPAGALRAAPKTYSVTDLPDNYRAVTFESEGGPLGLYGLYGMGMGMSGSRGANDKDSLLFGLMSASWVDPDEFQSALEGKLPRVRTLTLDLPSMIRRSGTSGSTPDPVFIETWVEAARISRWTPHTELTKEALVKAFGANAATGEPRGGPTDSLSKLKQVAVGALLYAGDWDDVFPKADSTAKAAAAIMPYVKSQSVFSTNNPAGKRILFNTSLSGISSDTIERPAETLLFWEEFSWSDGKRAVAYADGHAKRLTEEEWARAWSAELRRRAATRQPAKAMKKKG
ncbi:hypothetical protein EON79_11760 [bacterium]|nr:MAG: hypothetical protein EON79_11760 [bacterium]